MLFCLYTTVQDMASLSQMAVGAVSLLGSGGVIVALWFGAKLDRFKLQLFKELDERYVEKSVCTVIQQAKAAERLGKS